MRLRRVHLEGLQSPRGGHALLFRPGYNVVLSAEPAQRRGIRRLLEGLLYPGRLGKLSDWCLPASADPARAALEFEAAGEAYRIVVDFAAERVGLGRSGAEARGYRLHAEGPGEVDACLDLGFEFAQGYFFGRPLSADDWRKPTWDDD